MTDLKETLQKAIPGATVGHSPYISRKRTCKRKIRYSRLDTALAALFAMQTKGIQGLEAYHCPHCEGFHLGHKLSMDIKIEINQS